MSMYSYILGEENRMGHHHSHTHDHQHEKGVSNIALAFFLNFGFAIIEIIGGVLTGSTAILSDAIHDFGDSLALAFSFVVEKVGHKEANSHYTYGFKRMSLIGALTNIIILSIGTLFVIQEAIGALVSPQPVKAGGMLVLAIVGMIINGLSVVRMKGSRKILDKTVMMHLMEDLLGWIAVLIVSIVIYFTNWYILDPILSLGICVIIGRNIYGNLITAIQIMMQAVPDQELYEQIKGTIEGLETVVRIEEMHMWTMDGEDHVVTATLVAMQGESHEVILREVKALLHEQGIKHTTIEIW